MENYEEIIKKTIGKEKIKKIDLVSKTSNIVFKVEKNDGEINYAKFYLNNSSHIDHELNLYGKVNKDYLKEKIFSSENPKIAIYKELKGKTIDELSLEELNKESDKIVSSVCDFFDEISKNKANGYGLLDKDMNGIYENFDSFITNRQKETSNQLKDYSNLSNIFDIIYKTYSDILFSDNSLVPIDTNMKNIMITEDGSVKFIDPGELISGPILMAYGDFIAHTYKTIIYDKLIKKLNLTDEEEKQIRIYAIFSSLNILSFLNKNGVTNLEDIIPYGNKYTFCELIDDHMKKLGLKK